MSNILTVVDLYSGVGGFSLGFHQAGFDVELAVDNHEVTLDTFQQNFPNSKTSKFDLRKIGTERILPLISTDGEEIDAVIGGPPCQGFSVMGTGEMNDKRNDLLLRFADHAVNLSPRYIVLENVKGLMSNPAKSYLERYLQILDSGGYEYLTPIRTLNARNFGVPQNRERVFVIAHREEENPPATPTPTTRETSVWGAIQDIPSRLDNSKIKNGTLVDGLGQTSSYVEMLNSWKVPGKNKQNGLSGMEPVNHTEEVKERFATVEPGEVDGPSQFYRLEKDGISPTLRAGSSSKRGNHTAARPIHPVEPRVITVRESARLQSFPDWFEFHSTKYHALRQIGNSVPPLLARDIGEAIREAAI